LNLTILVILLIGLVVSAVVCVTLSDLLKAAIALAATSAILSVIMFLMGAPLAAVFELSVCAGMITVVFISACSMSRIHTREEHAQRQKARNRRFLLLPALLAALAVVAFLVLSPHITDASPALSGGSGSGVQAALWGSRQVDLLGQIILILTGVYGVIVFFKEKEADSK
jgi:NADH-quinone oxidoreductase subunit J